MTIASLLSTSSVGLSLGLAAALLTAPASASAGPASKTAATKATPAATTAPSKMPPVCDARAFTRVPDREHPNDCDYLYRNPIPRTCQRFVVFYSLLTDNQTFHAIGICNETKSVFLHIMGATRGKDGSLASSEFALTNSAISAGVVAQSMANSLFSFGVESGAGYIPKGGGPGPIGPGGEDPVEMLILAAQAHFSGQDVAQKYLHELGFGGLPATTPK